MAFGRCGVGSGGGGSLHVGEITLVDKSANSGFLPCDGRELTRGQVGYDALSGILPGVNGEWEHSSYAVGVYPRKMAYGDGKYVAVGGAGPYSVAISTDGATWDLHEVPDLTYQPFDIIYGGGLWVMVCGYREILVSTDAINWTKVLSRPSSDAYSITQVAYGGGMFVAVGISVVSTLGAPAILYSRDGYSWTEKASGASSALYGVAYGSGRFVIVGNSGYLATSEDGVAWTTRTGAAAGTNISSIAYGNGTFVLCDASYYPSTSPDGVAWTKHGRAPNANTSMSILVFGGDVFHAFYSDSSYNRCVASSKDGATWALELTLPNAQAPADFAYGHAGWLCLISSATYPYYVKVDKLILPTYAAPAYIKIED